MTDKEGVAALTHLSAIFTWVIGPAAVLILSEDEFVRDNAKQALNWQINFTILGIVSSFLVILLIGLLLIPLLMIADIVLCVIATMKASEGEVYQYPFTIQFLKTSTEPQ